jgi:hypothetical protein
MDASAIALARDNDVPIIVFSLDEPGGFRGILAGAGDLYQGPVTAAGRRNAGNPVLEY